MSTSPSLAVVVPVLNTPIEHLAECLESVIIAGQRYPGRFVLSVVDDGSNRPVGKSITSMIDYATLPPNVSVTLGLHRSTRGIAAARNTGVGQANCEWFALVDSDDLVHPDAFILASYEMLEDVVFIFSDHVKRSTDLSDEIEVRRKGRYAHLLRQYAGTVLDPFLHSTFLIHMHLIKTSAYSAIGQFDEAIRYGDEIDFHLRLTRRYRRPANYRHLESILYIYRDSPGGVCGDERKYEELIDTIERLLLTHARARGLAAATCRKAGKDIDGAVRYFYTFEEAE